MQLLSTDRYPSLVSVIVVEVQSVCYGNLVCVDCLGTMLMQICLKILLFLMTIALDSLLY